MAVDEAEHGVVEGELDHDAAFPPVANHVLHDQVLARVPHEAAVLVFHPDAHEHLAFHNEFDSIVFFTKIARYQIDLVFVRAATLLSSKDNDIVVLVVWEHGLEVDRLNFSCMVPGHTHNIKWDLALNQVFHHD